MSNNLKKSTDPEIQAISQKRISALESKYKSLLWEKRILTAAFIMGLLGTFLFILSFSTPHWIFVTLGRLQERNAINRGGGFYWKKGHYHGLWRICREELWPTNASRNPKEATENLYCRPMYFSLPENMKNLPPERLKMETKMLDFRRSTIAVGFIALMLAFLTHVFTFYSLDQLRYMYKRLAGCLNLITGGSCWVTLEVFRQMHLYEEYNMKTFVPEFDQIRYGWSYKIIWLILVLFLIPGVVLFVCSKKKKRSKARSLKEARENEPVQLGRW